MNLTVLERSVRAVLSAASGGGYATLVGQYALFLRTVLFFVAVIYVLTATSLQPLAFLAGLLAIVPAVLWHGLTPAAPQD